MWRIRSAIATLEHLQTRVHDRGLSEAPKKFPLQNSTVYITQQWPPLLSSGQSYWLQIQRSGFDSRRYQIFWKVVGSSSLETKIEELLEWKCSDSGLENREYGRRDPSRAQLSNHHAIEMCGVVVWSSATPNLVSRSIRCSVSRPCWTPDWSRDKVKSGWACL
jgi:hypothetical protein